MVGASLPTISIDISSTDKPTSTRGETEHGVLRFSSVGRTKWLKNEDIGQRNHIGSPTAQRTPAHHRISTPEPADGQSFFDLCHYCHRPKPFLCYAMLCKVLLYLFSDTIRPLLTLSYFSLLNHVILAPFPLIRSSSRKYFFFPPVFSSSGPKHNPGRLFFFFQ